MSEFDLLKKFAVGDILSVSGKEKASHTIDKHLNSAYELGCIACKIEQQKKIDAVLKYLDGCEYSLDVDIDSIKELLK